MADEPLVHPLDSICVDCGRVAPSREATGFVVGGWQETVHPDTGEHNGVVCGDCLTERVRREREEDA